MVYRNENVKTCVIINNDAGWKLRWLHNRTILHCPRKKMNYNVLLRSCFRNQRPRLFWSRIYINLWEVLPGHVFWDTRSNFLCLQQGNVPSRYVWNWHSNQHAGVLCGDDDSADNGELARTSWWRRFLFLCESYNNVSCCVCLAPLVIVYLYLLS